MHRPVELARVIGQVGFSTNLSGYSFQREDGRPWHRQTLLGERGGCITFPRPVSYPPDIFDGVYGDTPSKLGQVSCEKVIAPWIGYECGQPGRDGPRIARMQKWLRALLSETVFTAWWLLSALSTLSTFFFRNWSGKPRLISAILAIVGFAWANFRVFQKQQKRITELNVELASHRERTSQLRITVGDGSRYILMPVGDLRRADFNAAFLEFHLMIENTGRRPSTVNNYRVEILELQRTFSDLQPQEGRHHVQGRHCQYGLDPRQILSTTGLVAIDEERATKYGALLFYIPGVMLEQFVNAGLQTHGTERKFDPLRCRLTVTDTTGSSTTAEFRLFEA